MPPTWDPLDDDPATGDSIPVAFLELEGRTLELRSGFAGASAPADPQDGQVWVDTSAVPYRVYRYLRVGAGPASWQPMGPLSRLPASINGDPSPVDDRIAPFEHLALRLENRADLPPPGPTNAGLIVFRTGDGEVWVADSLVSGGWKGLLSVAKDQSRDTLELALADAFPDATNPPTAAVKGVLAGLLFDATNEKLTLAAVVPRNWQGASDLRVRVFQILDQAEIAGNDIEWTGEVRTLLPGQEKVTKAATALADTVLDIGANPEGIDDGGGPHVSELVLDHDDAVNPVSLGGLVLVTLWRKTVGGAGKAGGTVVFRVDLTYVQAARHERA
jgi:hypothetical protein